jgi:DNA mismatch endonuclease, patch repair protein
MSEEKRSALMSRVRSTNTKPEILIRRGLHCRGFRFRIHQKLAAGKPDIVLPRWKTVVLVNGCFWHGHSCDLFRWPKSREEFWRKKIETNRERDQKMLDQLVAGGWRVATVWECGIRNRKQEELDILLERLSDWIKRKSGETRCEFLPPDQAD